MIELIDATLPAMRAKKWGRIVALTSTSVKQPIATIVLSNAFRTALVAALKTLAGEVAVDGVTVNCHRDGARSRPTGFSQLYAAAKRDARFGEGRSADRTRRDAAKSSRRSSRFCAERRQATSRVRRLRSTAV